MIFHKHQWKRISIAHMYRCPSQDPTQWNQLPTEPVTLVTFLCAKCKQYKQQTLQGWIEKGEIE